MSTLNHEVFANGTTPLWLSATSGGQTASPFNVVNSLSAPTTKTTIVDGNASAGVYFAPYGATEDQAYGEVKFEITPSVALKTNGKSILTATPSNVTITTPIVVDNPQTSSVLTISTNAIGNFSNSDAIVGFGSDYVNLGTTAYVGAGDGLVVYTGGFSNYAEVLPTSFSFGQSVTSPLTTTENFSTATIGVLGWTSQTGVPFDNYVWSSDNPNGDAQGGLSYTDPMGSVKAVTNTGAPSSSKCAWLGGFNTASGGQYSSYLEFAPITAPIGTQVSVSWKHAGSVFSIVVYKNDAVFSTALNVSGNRPNTTSWTTPPVMPFTFISTGLDTLYIQVQNPTGAGYTYTPYNLSDIAVTIQGQTEYENGSLSVTGSAGSSTLRLANSFTPTINHIDLLPTSVSINADDGVSLTGSVVVSAGDTTITGTNTISLNTPGVINSVSSNFNLYGDLTLPTGQLNMSAHNISNVGNVEATQVFTAATYTGQLYTASGLSNIAVFNDMDYQSSNNLNNVRYITAGRLNGNPAFTSLQIGEDPSCYTTINNTLTIRGAPPPTSSYGGELDLFGTTNRGCPLCPPATAYYLGNVILPLLPNGNHPGSIADVPNSAIFGTSLSLGLQQGITIPPRTTFALYTLPFTTYTTLIDNTDTRPAFYNFSGTGTSLNPSASNQAYWLQPYLEV